MLLFSACVTAAASECIEATNAPVAVGYSCVMQMTNFRSFHVVVHAAVLVVAGLPTVACAGGEWATMQIESFTEFGGSAFRIVAKPLSHADSPIAPGCVRFTVEGKWSPTPSNKPLPSTLREHENALTLLRNANKASSPILLGAMIDGLPLLDEKRPCVFSSQGLTVLKDSNGRSVVFSYAR
jgi:hypothetical protein